MVEIEAKLDKVRGPGRTRCRAAVRSRTPSPVRAHTWGCVCDHMCVSAPAPRHLCVCMCGVMCVSTCVSVSAPVPSRLCVRTRGVTRV